MVKILASHQPNFLPYLGFFDKMRVVDELSTESGVFILAPNCQYNKEDFQGRNKIKIYNGWKWLNVPVEHERIPIQDIKIRTRTEVKNLCWNEYNLKLLYDNYQKAPFFKKFFPGIEEILLEQENKLSKLNEKLIRYLAQCFEISTQIISSDNLPKNLKESDATRTIINEAEAVGADTYLSGLGGKNYLDESQFGNGVELLYQNFKHPIYPQRYTGFESNMSAIDALFNIGRLPKSGEVIE